LEHRARSTNALTPLLVSALPTAVALAVIAPRANQNQLTARRPSAGEDSERLVGDHGAPAVFWTSAANRAIPNIANRATTRRLKARTTNPGFRLLGRAPSL
jgi:hypothetical protein